MSGGKVYDFRDGKLLDRAAPVAAEPEPELPLKGGGGGGTLPPVVPIKEYVDKADEAVESRLNAKLDKLPTMDALRANIWGAALTILGVLLAIAAFAADRFDGGMSAGGLMDRYTSAQRERDAAQDKKLDEILRRLPQPAPTKSARP